MKVVVRTLDEPSLEDGVAKLRIHAYPQFPETRDVEFYSSAYRWLKSHPLGNEMHRWVAVADGGQVVGHLAATPQYYRIGGQRVVAHTPCDYMVHSRHGFQALSLMRRFFRATENCVACDMVPAVIGVEIPAGGRGGGATAIRGEAPERLQAPIATDPFAGEETPETWGTDRDRSRVR